MRQTGIGELGRTLQLETCHVIEIADARQQRIGHVPGCADVCNPQLLH